MSGGEFRVPNATINAIFTPDQWNRALRAFSRELLDLFQFLSFAGTTPAAKAGGVIGFAAAVVAGQPQLTVQPGMGFYYDSAAALPQSKFTLLRLDTATTLNFSDGDGTHDRIDLVQFASPSDTDTEESTMIKDSVNANRDIMRGAIADLQVKEGTPASSPVAPSPDPGYIGLWTVQVNANETDLDAATLTDIRVKAARFENRDGSASMPLRTGSADRTWEREVHFGACKVSNSDEADIITGIDSTTSGYPFRATKQTTNTSATIAMVAIPADIRGVAPADGVEVIGGTINYQLVEAFTGTVAITAKLMHVDESGVTEVGTKTIANSVAAGKFDLTVTNEVTLQGSLFAFVSIVITGTPGNSDGSLRVYSMGAKFREPIPE